MKKRFLLVTVISAITVFLVSVVVVYDVRFNDDSYDIWLRNRFTKLGYGIDYKEGLELWHFAHTVHGGRAEKRFFSYQVGS